MADQLAAFEQALADRRRDILAAMERSNAELVTMVGRYVAELRTDLAVVAIAIESAVRRG